MTPVRPRTPRDPREQLRTGSLTRRVTLLVLVLLALMLAVLALTTDVVLSARLKGDLRQRLVDRAVVASALADQVGSQDLVDRLEGQGVSIYLVTGDGQIFARGDLRPSGTPTVPAAPGPGPKGGPAGAGPAGPAIPVTTSGDILQVTQLIGDGDTITLLVDQSEVVRTLTQVRIALLVGAGCVLLLAVLVLGPTVARALRPLDQMTGTAREIAAGDRGRRLNPDRPGTELGRTASAFDAMLDAVEGAETQAVTAETRLRQFVSDAAHELRTPLAGVVAAAERQLRSDPDREQREQLSVTVIREARRASRLVENLLDMARIDQGLPLDRRPLDLAALARGVVATRGLGAPEASFRVTGSAPLVSADHDRVTQILTNLVQNSLQAAGPTADIGIELSAPTTATVQVDVVDDGPGIGPGDHERIFERLVRLDPARVRRAGVEGPVGAGLGLSIARGLAQTHGGTLVSVPVDRGARFRLTLPQE